MAFVVGAVNERAVAACACEAVLVVFRTNNNITDNPIKKIMTTPSKIIVLRCFSMHSAYKNIVIDVKWYFFKWYFFKQM